jgi:Sulfotransferase family
VIDALARAGYLPVRIDWEHHTLRLQALAGAEFREPFFQQTVAQAEDSGQIDVPLDEFVGGAKELEWTQPLRAILHTGRCGSTLLANLLALRPESMVLKEPGFVNQAVARQGPLSALVKYSARVASESQRRLIVKATSWTSPALLNVALTQPEARCVLLWRDPVDVVASEVAVPPGWARDACAATYASAWQTVARAFVAAATTHPHEMLLLSYDALVHDKPGSLRRVESWFGSAPRRLVPDEFWETARAYAKSGSEAEYQPTGAHYRPPLGSDERASVQAVTSETVRALFQLS